MFLPRVGPYLALGVPHAWTGFWFAILHSGDIVFAVMRHFNLKLIQ